MLALIQALETRFRATAPGPMSWTGHTMTQIIGKLSAVVSSLFGPVSHKSNTVEQRTTDHHTGNVALKKRRLSQRGDDEPSWIDEDARSRLWDRHIKCLHQGLSQATMCIKDQHAGDLDRRSAQRFSYRGDKFAHLKLENLVTLVMPITHASAVIEHLYSRDMLEQAKHYNKTPQARVRYRLERNGEDVSIDHAIRLLENLPSELVPILESWHVDDRLLRTVCNDLYALLAKRPIPSLVVNASPETLSLWERMARVPADEDVVMSDAPNTTVSPALLAIPGSFPEEDTNRVADAQPNLHTAEFAASRSAQSEMPLAPKDSLPTFHDVIPFDLIQAHFVDPQSADTYSEKGSSDAHHNRSMRSILKDKLRSTSSPNAARTSRHRSRDHNPDHSPYKARSSVGSAIVSPVSKRSTSRSPPSYITRLKSPNSMRMTATSSASLFTPTSPSRQNTGHYFVSAGGKEAEDVVDDDQTTQIAEGSNTNLVHREAYDDTLSDKEATHSTSIWLLSHRDIADGHRDTARYLRHHIDEQEGQVESDSADEKQEDREHDVLTRHGASINVHMQEGLRKYYRPSSPFSGSDLDKQLSGLQISDERQSALDEVALRRQVEEEEREFLAAVAAKAAAEAEKKRADAEKLLKTGGLRPPHKPMVAPLSDDWLRKVEASVTRQGASVARTFEGTELTPRDFARVVPPTEWLNDEIVNGTLLWLDRFINLAAGVSDARSANRKCLALSSFIWKRIQDAGPGSTGRALRRFGVSKANFGDLDTVLLPVCENSHWTLIVVRPKMRTIAHMDSLSVAGSASKLKRAQAWVKAVLEENFIEAEWRVVRHEAPRQTNGYDCGVHTITNGMCIALGLNAIDTYASDQMPLQRLRIAAMLLNGGFSKDFDLAADAGDNDFIRAFKESCEFTSGYGVAYKSNALNWSPEHPAQSPLINPSGSKLRTGRLLINANVTRVVDANVVHLEQEVPMNGSFRIFVFAGKPTKTSRALSDFADGLQARNSFYATNQRSDIDMVSYHETHNPHSHFFTICTIFAATRSSIEIARDVPKLMARYRDHVYADDLWDRRVPEAKAAAHAKMGLDEEKGGVVVVRPDGYVGVVVGLAEGSGTVDALNEYFASFGAKQARMSAQL
ncbi:hypothetical protein BN1708_002304 [Verticillium longisporum]|uniref:Ubiquitin-like protease family profile domain-containing protein n=1 Tax=Verticillium longisporum TaxID=100787 RepID=A0A0G4KQ07_VERLO|nr:hypothetical protein BN1708_002304 [Verticillium longisporum]